MTNTSNNGLNARGTLHDGLEGIVVAETALSEIDGQRGQLIIAGLGVEQLAESHSYEQAVARLWRGLDALQSDAHSLRDQLGKARAEAFLRLASLGDALSLEDGMDALRASVAHLPQDASAPLVVSAVGVFAAAWARQRAGLSPVEPDPELGHAHDLLRMLGCAHDAARARALDAYLVTVIDHGLNASTFAARVVASTRSDRVSSVVAALGALKGPLHGGAPGPVLDMLDRIAASGDVEGTLRELLLSGQRIMGMGHRVYRVRDPRAHTLERAIEQLANALHEGTSAEDRRVQSRLALAREVERSAQRALAERSPERALQANVEFYTAVLLEALGVPRALFTPLFAASRVAGWVAHIAEQSARGRLIRPASRYVGPAPATLDGAADWSA